MQQESWLVKTGMEGLMEETIRYKWPQQSAEWQQLCVLVLNGSISMIWEVETEELGHIKKAEAVNYAVRKLFARFNMRWEKFQYTFAVVKFHEYVTEEVPPTPVTLIDDAGDYDPTSAGIGPTFIGSGLE